MDEPVTRPAQAGPDMQPSPMNETRSDMAPDQPKIRRPWDLYRFLVVASAGVMFLAIGAFFEFNYVVAAQTLISDPPFLISWLIGLAGALTLATYVRPWVYLAAGILVSLMPLMVLVFFGWHELMNPTSGFPFIGSALALLTVLLALPAGIRGFQAARKGGAAPTLRSGWRTGHGAFAVGAALLLVGAIAAASLSYREALGGEDSGVFFTPSDVGAETRELTMMNFAFQPKSLDVPVNNLTAITIRNEDSETHTFTYELGGQTHSLEVLGGVETTAWVFFAQAGTYPFRCIPHSEGYEDNGENMVGSITVA